MANFIERMWLAMGIILAVLLPLSSVIPPVYQFRIRSRIFRWYAQLRHIEEAVSNSDNADELISQLDQLEARVQKISVPLSYTNELYSLRSNIALIRNKLSNAH